MKGFGCHFGLMIKRYLKKSSFVFVLVTMPVIFLALALFYQLGPENRHQVLIYVPDEDKSSMRIVESLRELESEFNFVSCSSRTEMENLVKNRKALCGFVFKKDLSKRLEAESYSRNITLVARQEGGFVRSCQEQLYSLYLKEMCYQLACDIIYTSTGITENTQNRQEYERLLTKDMEGFLEINYLNESSVMGEVSSSGNLMFNVSCAMAVIMFLGSFMGLGNWLKDRQQGVLVSLYRGNEILLILLYTAVPVMLLGVSTVITLGIWNCISRGAYFSLAYVLRLVAAVVLYGAVLIVLALGTGKLLSFMEESAGIKILLALEVVLILACMSICPLFVDFGNFISAFRVLRAFVPPQWFLYLLNLG